MDGSQRRHLVVTAAAVSALALGIGWMLGRGGSGTGVAVPTTAVAATGLTGSTVPTVDRNVGGSTTTGVHGWTLASAGVDDRTAALGISVIGVRPGLVFELNTGTGVLAELEVGARYAQPPHIDAGNNWFLVRRDDLSFSQLFRRDDDPVPIRTGYASEVFLVPGTDRFWRVITPVESGRPAHVVQLDHEGRETGLAFDFDGPGRAVGSDPAGGVIVVAPGGSYHAGLDGSQRLTTGDIVAISATEALITECSDNLTTCGLVVLDRTSGATRPLEPVLPVGNPDTQIYDSGASYGFPALLSAISPDGRYAPVVINGSRLRFGVIDLTTGDFFPLGLTPQSGLWWAPGGRYVMYLFNTRLMMYDFETRIAFEATPGTTMTAFAVRPAS